MSSAVSLAGLSSISFTTTLAPCAAKSNAVYTAFNRAMETARKSGSLDVPIHLRNAPTRLMKELGYGDAAVFQVERDRTLTFLTMQID